MAGNLSADCRGRATQTLCDDPHRVTAGDSARDVFALGQCKRPRRTATSGRRNSTVTGQNEVNNYVILTQSTANLIQRLTGLPALPQLGFLLRRKPSWLLFDHKHHLRNEL